MKPLLRLVIPLLICSGAVIGAEVPYAAKLQERRQHLREAEAEVRSLIAAANNADALAQARRAMGKLEYDKEDPPELRLALNKTLIELWLRAIAKCEELMDPNYHPDHPDYLPYFSVAPPVGLHRKDGSLDEAAWEKYQQAIRDNHARADRARAQSGLRQNRSLYMQFLRVLVEGSFLATPEGVEFVEKKIAELIPSAASRAEVEQVVFQSLRKRQEVRKGPG